MHPWSLCKKIALAVTLCLAPVVAATLASPCDALAQADASRVLWHIEFDSALSANDQNAVHAAMLKTLARTNERHFVGDNILRQKIIKEGLNFPECFTEGKPCPEGGSFMLDVHNVDAFVKARFANQNGLWKINLNLYQSTSSSVVQIQRSSANLEELIADVAASLFEMEAAIEVTSNVPDVEVYINQKRVGTTPLSLKIPVGNQTVTFKKTGYVEKSWSFIAEKGNIHSKNVELEPEVVQLSVLVTDPDASIDINNEPWGLANETHDITPGDKHIDVHSTRYNDFSMDYKVYPGNPQTVNIALLPKSRSPYEIRHRNISRYRWSLSAGYHLAYQSFALDNSHIGIDGVDEFNGEYSPEGTLWAKTLFHGFTASANYEDKYWGLSLFKFDMGFANLDKQFNIVRDTDSNPLRAHAKNAMFIGFYPAQIKAHVTFWIMQAEATAGVGLSYLNFKADINDDVVLEDAVFSRLAFSTNFDFGFKVFFSEESFLMASYDLQYDVEQNHGHSSLRHGFSASLGFQIPAFMRRTDSGESEPVVDVDQDIAQE